MKRTLYASLLVVSMTACGCNNSPDPAVTNNVPGEVKPATISPGTVTGQPGQNPAAGVDLRSVGPEVVVDQFLRALQQGNRQMVSTLLTDIARTETSRFGLEVQPESVPNSAFRIIEAVYLPVEDPNAPPQVAHVASLWAEDGGEEAYEIIWVLKHEQAGWRISAMGLTIDFNKDPLLLDFEHPEEMMKARDAAMQELASQEAAAAAAQTNSQGQGVPGNSETPSYPSQQGVVNQPNSLAPGNSQFQPASNLGNPAYTPDGSSLRQNGPQQATQPGGVENPIRR